MMITFKEISMNMHIEPYNIYSGILAKFLSSLIDLTCNIGLKKYPGPFESAVYRGRNIMQHI